MLTHQAVNPERRTWDSPVRQPWNPHVHSCLQAIDGHVHLYLRDGDVRHMQMANALRDYVHHLKRWIHETEATRRSQDAVQ
jgi:hypothetical protein